MPRFVRMATLDEIPPGSTKEVEHDGRIFAIYNLDGRLAATDGICPHQGGPLAEGVLTGTVVTCPWHGWQFDVTDGRSGFGERVRIPTFEVKVEGGAVFVAVP